MYPISYRRHRFPPAVIQHAVWLYLRFTLSYRDVEELLAERGLDISYESVRSWVLKFGPAIARALRQRRPRPSDRWHLDEISRATSPPRPGSRSSPGPGIARCMSASAETAFRGLCQGNERWAGRGVG